MIAAKTPIAECEPKTLGRPLAGERLSPPGLGEPDPLGRGSVTGPPPRVLRSGHELRGEAHDFADGPCVPELECALVACVVLRFALTVFALTVSAVRLLT